MFILVRKRFKIAISLQLMLGCSVVLLNSINMLPIVYLVSEPLFQVQLSGSFASYINSSVAVQLSACASSPAPLVQWALNPPLTYISQSASEGKT